MCVCVCVCVCANCITSSSVEWRSGVQNCNDDKSGKIEIDGNDVEWDERFDYKQKTRTLPSTIRSCSACSAST